MRIVTLGARSNEPNRLLFRGTASLARYDALYVDFDLLRAEFDADLDHGVLTVRGSDALLRATRHWRDELARFMREERIVVCGWTEPPLLRYHTMQAVFEFTPRDLLPATAPRVRAADRFVAKPTQGVPFAAFYRALCGALSSEVALDSERGEPILAGAKGETAGLYLFSAPAHLIFTAAPPGALIEPALQVLGETLGGGRASAFLPSWLDEVPVDGEAAQLGRLAALEAAGTQIERELAAARRETRRLRHRKAIVGGTPVQAVAAASERLRELGAVVMREFPEDHAFVTVASDLPPLLWFFVLPGIAATSAGRLRQLCLRYQHEFDEVAQGVIVVVAGPQADRDAALSPRLPEPPGDGKLVSGYALLRALSDPAPNLATRLAPFCLGATTE